MVVLLGKQAIACARHDLGIRRDIRAFLARKGRPERNLALGLASERGPKIHDQAADRTRSHELVPE